MTTQWLDVYVKLEPLPDLKEPHRDSHKGHRG